MKGGDLEVGRVDADGDGGTGGLLDGKSLDVNDELSSVDLENRQAQAAMKISQTIKP